MGSSVVSIMLPAFVECLVLVGIHSYLGLHVIKRKVIFVDLALAQIAALGATVGFLFGMAPTSKAAFLFSMAFTFVGAAVFAATRLRKDRVPQEAVIGLVYALTAAITILVVDKSPHGAEHIKDLLTGTILWVKWSEIAWAAAAYAVVGVFHYLLRKPFIAISEDPDAAFKAGRWVRLWDFFFYVSFGFVISFSVRTAGVLLVFVFLVAPAIMAVVITHRWSLQLLIGWGVGTLVTFASLVLSYVLDLPSGPTVVAFYGVVLLVVSVVVHLVRAPARRAAFTKVGVGVATVLAVVAAMWTIGSQLGRSAWAHDEAHAEMGHERDERLAIATSEPATDAGTTAPEEQAPADPEQRVADLRTQVSERRGDWRAALVQTILDPSLPLLFKEDALQLLREQAKTDFGFDTEAKDNSEAARKMQLWAREPNGG